MLSGLLGISMITSVFSQQASLAEKDRQIRDLKKQVERLNTQHVVLSNAFTKSKKAEAIAREEILELTNRLQALGLYEGSKENKLLQAVADGRLLSDQLRKLKESSTFALDALKEFVKVAEVHDPEQRKNVEIAIRKLEADLWGGKKPDKKGIDKLGTLQDAEVISIDSQSGMLVLNIGKKTECKQGMVFQIKRGERSLGEGMITEVRTNVSGLLVVSRAKTDVVFRVGDTVHIKLQPQ